MMDKLEKLYGKHWYIDAPPHADPIVLEGFVDVTSPPTDKPLVVCSHSPEENTVIVIHRIETEYFDYNTELQTMVEQHPACQAGRLEWTPRVSQRPLGTMSTEFNRRDGFYGAPIAPANVQPTTESGLGKAGFINIERSPAIALSGKSFDITIATLDLTVGLPIPENTRRVFFAKATGFSLSTV